MPELFWNMMKEEWRVHSTMFGSLSFALFPVMIFGIAFMGSFLLPLMRASFPSNNLALMIHASYLMLGIMVGGFGLLGNEVMNRRFGQASLLAYSARSLPLSERFIFTNFVIKDTVYYFFLWVFPFGLGFILASPFIGVPLANALLLLLTLTLSFLFGLCTVFFLSTIFARSKQVFWLLILILCIGLAGLVVMTGTNPALLFPPLLLSYIIHLGEPAGLLRHPLYPFWGRDHSFQPGIRGIGKDLLQRVCAPAGTAFIPAGSTACCKRHA